MTTTTLMWFSVETPTVFREYLLPQDGVLAPDQQRQYDDLLDLADMHRTTIQCSASRRG